jgi:3-oxoacyl-[acyl-carrier protein] reductase
MTRLDRHVALVTGAANGIGRAVATRLVSEGAAVILADRDAERAASVAAELGSRAMGVAMDVSDAESVDAGFSRGEEVFGPVTLLVNNAGHVHQALFEDIAVHEFDRMLSVHLRGTFLCSQRALRPMLAAGQGVIINMASQLGQVGGIELAHYSAAKAGVIGMTKAMARELSPRGVRVNAIAPGPINTDLVRALSPSWREKKTRELPLGRFGEPSDVASVVVFLAGDEAGIFVGQTLGPNCGDVML